MKKARIMILLMGISTLIACNTTRLTSTWREPNKVVNIPQLNKVLVVALFQSETSRRKAEDQMIGYLEGKGVVSYDYLDKDISVKSEEVIRQKIKQDGFDGAITMRLMDVDKERVNYRSNNLMSPYFNTFSGYYFLNWPYYANSSYYSTTKTYTVETIVFSISEDKVIWTGTTQTTDPDGLTKMTEEIAKVVYDKMIKDGFIKK
ncbi:MAG: hypothetical protein ACOVOW_18305 [Spirosomataceae bacterium]